MISAARSKSTFSSWSPTSALVAGVKMGSGELLGLPQALRQLDPAHGASGLVVLPAGPGDVAAHDALDREHLELLDQHRAAADLLGDVRVGHEMVRHDVLGAREPEGREAGEHHALAGDRRGVNHVVGGDAVRGDHEQAVSLLVDLPDLAGCEELVALERGGFAHDSEANKRACRCPVADARKLRVQAASFSPSSPEPQQAAAATSPSSAMNRCGNWSSRKPYWR